MSDEEIVKALSFNEDFQFIAETNLKILSKLMDSKIDFSNFNFSDQNAFLKILDMTKEQYLEQVIKVKAAAARISFRYNIDAMSDGRKCLTCDMNDNEKIEELKKTLIRFKNDSKAYQGMKNQLSNILNDSKSWRTEVAGGACCTGWFYVCVTLCALTIEAFPAYLLCCSLCYASYCCSTGEPNE